MTFSQLVADRMHHRLSGVIFVFIPIILAGVVLRIAFAASVWADLDGIGPLIGAIGFGFLQDLIYASYVAIPTLFYLALVPQRLFASKVHRLASWLLFACVWWMVLFQLTAEWIFWDEFGVRFNFIAVDYLVYTTEVIDNIVQSYPIGKIFALIAAFALLANTFYCRWSLFRAWLDSETPIRSRVTFTVAMLAVPVLATALEAQSDMPRFNNRYDH
jgi:hypothetical protein